MNVLIAGGSGFLGRALIRKLQGKGHAAFTLTRRPPRNPNEILWDGVSDAGWGERVGEMDAVVNLTGFGLEHWPWTQRQKQRFLDSRVKPGLALVSAIKKSARRPRLFLQTSGINHYGLRGDGIADESFPPADDFLAQLTVKWEAATKPVEEFGVRHVVMRTAVVLARRGGLLPLMALPVRLFFGGRLGSGQQAMPWIHIDDWTGAACHLLEDANAEGAYNFIAPESASNEKFMRALAAALHRPYWFHVPAFLLKVALGEMNVLILEGRRAQPRRLIESGYKFQFAGLEDAFRNLFE